jgi:hypothetical protein
MSIALDFETDIREAVLARLPHDPAYAAELRALPPVHQLVAFINWHSRLIPPVPREVSQSWEFAANPLRWDPRYRVAVEHIIDALRLGRDLTPHLSRAVKVGYQPGTSSAYGRRSDLDLLLNDWNVHHLHLSTAKEADGFVKRTGPLLFAIVESKQAFLIDILEHGSWSRERIAHVMIDNWPNAYFVQHRPVVVSAPAVSEAERRARRDAGIQTGLVEHHGRHYAIGMGGLTSAATNVQHTRLANLICRGLKAFEEALQEQPDYVAETLRLNDIPVPPVLDVHFILRGDGWFALREENTRVLLPIPGLPRDPA